MSFFLWRVDYALDGLVVTEQMCFLPLFSFCGVVTRILIFCGYCFWSTWFASWCKNIFFELFWNVKLFIAKLISQAPEDAILKIKRPVYERLFKSRATCRPKRRCKSICEQSVFSPIGACIRIWCTVGAVEGRSQMFVKNASSLISQMAFLILKMR